jgi:hypothetical protein
MDVLCGRGGLANRHDGNLVYRKVVEANKALFRSIPNQHKMFVAESIVMAIQQAGGRFLECPGAPGCGTKMDATTDPKALNWVEISFKKAVAKTSQALRENNDRNHFQGHRQQHQHQFAESVKTPGTVVASAEARVVSKTSAILGRALFPPPLPPRDRIQVPWRSLWRSRRPQQRSHRSMPPSPPR